MRLFFFAIFIVIVSCVSENKEDIRNNFESEIDSTFNVEDYSNIFVDTLNNWLQDDRLDYTLDDYKLIWEILIDSNSSIVEAVNIIDSLGYNKKFYNDVTIFYEVYLAYKLYEKVNPFSISQINLNIAKNKIDDYFNEVFENQIVFKCTIRKRISGVFFFMENGRLLEYTALMHQRSYEGEWALVDSLLMIKIKNDSINYVKCDSFFKPIEDTDTLWYVL